MTLRELVEIADLGYRKGFSDLNDDNCLSSLLDHVDKEGRPFPATAGDGLAKFIVQELYETYDMHTSSGDQHAEAWRAMHKAVADLQNVANVLVAGAFAAYADR